jgi:hypothetical protein
VTYGRKFRDNAEIHVRLSEKDTALSPLNSLGETGNELTIGVENAKDYYAKVEIPDAANTEF